MAAKTLRIAFNDLHPEVQRAARTFLAGTGELGPQLMIGFSALPGFGGPTGGLPIVAGAGVVMGPSGKLNQAIAQRLTQRVIARIREFGIVKPEAIQKYSKKGLDVKNQEKSFPNLRVEANGDITLLKA